MSDMDEERNRISDVNVPVVEVSASTPPTSTQPMQATVRVNGVDVDLYSTDCVRGADLKKATGLRVYDPGYANTLSCHSAVTHIDGSQGVLSHRGYRLETLVAHCSYTEVAYLIVLGDLPSVAQHSAWAKALYKGAAAPRAARATLRALPRDAHPMGALVASLANVGATSPLLNPALHRGAYNSAASREAAVLAILRMMPHLAAAVIRHHRNCRTQFLKLPAAAQRWSYSKRFLYLVDPALIVGRGADARIRAVDALLTAHVDHEQNCSTAALRHLASSGVDIFSATAGATAALYGPLHGGACEAVVRMLRTIGTVDGVSSFLDRVKSGEERLMGFGHRVYKAYDPRAKVIRVLAKEAAKHASGPDVHLINVAEALEAAALADQYFASRRLFPNVDFYSGFVYLSIGLAPEVFPVMFALGRSAGWMAHWLEALADPDTRIARPHQIYIGEKAAREVRPIADRDDAKILPWIRSRRARM